MRLRTLLPLILLTLLLTPISFAQTPPESPGSSLNDYGIKPEQFYPGTLILQLMEAAEEEIAAAVEEAYAEGYKAGLLASMSETARYMALNERLQRDLKAQQRRLPNWVTLPLGFAGGFLTHWLIQR